VFFSISLILSLSPYLSDGRRLFLPTLLRPPEFFPFTGVRYGFLLRHSHRRPKREKRPTRSTFIATFDSGMIFQVSCRFPCETLFKFLACSPIFWEAVSEAFFTNRALSKFPQNYDLISSPSFEVYLAFPLFGQSQTNDLFRWCLDPQCLFQLFPKEKPLLREATLRISVQLHAEHPLNPQKECAL